MKLFKKSFAAVCALGLAVVGLAGCEDKAQTALEDAAKKVVLSQDKGTVTSDFEVTSVAILDGVTYKVEWTSDNKVATVGGLDSSSKFYTIGIDYLHNNSAEQNVTLTAKITKDGSKKSVEKEFKFSVPKFEVASIADYDAAKKGDTLTIAGVITARESYNSSSKTTSVYVATPDGGFEAYKLACATQEAYDNDLKVGNTIYVSGTVSTYNGLREFSPSTYIYDSSVANAPMAATDITAKVLAGTKIEADMQCKPVVLKNVTVLSNNGTNIVVGNPDDTAKSITVRISTYVISNTSNEYKALTALGTGDVCTINGFVGWYNGAQITPLSVSDVKKDNAQVAINEAKTKLTDKYSEDKEIELLATAENNFPLTYEVTAGNTAAAVTNGKLVITQGSEDVNVTLKITATLDNETKSENYAIKVLAKSSLTAGTHEETLAFTASSSIQMNDATKNYASDLNLSASFDVKAVKNDTTYGSVVGLNTGGGGYLRFGAPSTEVGAQLVIKIKGNDNFNVVIDKVEITYPTGNYYSKGFTVNGTACSEETAEYTIGSDTVTITATDKSKNADIKSIKITYTVTAK